jgi:L-lactate utilization protein LutC
MTEYEITTSEQIAERRKQAFIDTEKAYQELKAKQAKEEFESLIEEYGSARVQVENAPDMTTTLKQHEYATRLYQQIIDAYNAR